MNLNNLQITAEHRSNWQAIDLGVKMALRWYRPLLLSWLLPALLIYLPLSALFYESPWIAIVAVWWLKPLLERAPLLLISHYLFADDPLAHSGYRALLRVYWFDLLSALTWRRLDLKRSFNLAVTVLEQQKGSARKARCNLLQSGCGSSAGWLTITMVHLELILCIGFIALIVMLIPQHSDWSFIEPLLDHPLIFEHLYNCLYLTAIALLAPIYTACGFSLYINRRIELEAWDLELLFRHSMEKRSVARPAALSGMLIFLLCLGSAPYTQPAWADSFAESERLASKESILQTLESPPFVIEKSVSEWHWPDSNSDTEPSELPDWLKNLEHFDGLADFINSIALLIEIAVWIAIGLLLLYIGKQLYSQARLHRHSRRDASAAPSPPPVKIMGMPITRDSLPDDITAAVEAALKDDNRRQALSLLYRYSLSQLIHMHQAPLQSWHTEGECAELVSHAAPEEISRCFAELTRLWQQQAYAHLQPTPIEIRSVCEQIGRLLKP